MKTFFITILSMLFTGILPCGNTALSADTLTSEVRIYNNHPTLFVNGAPHSQMIYYCRDAEYYKQVLDARFPTLQIRMVFGFRDPDTFKDPSTDWSDTTLYDFSDCDKKLNDVMAVDRDILFIPRFYFAIGEWWFNAYPGDISTRDDGRYAGVEDGKKYPSYASENYRTIARGALEAYIKHMESSFGDRILGYQIGNGHYGEWFTWNLFSDALGRPQEGVSDYSRVALAGFRAFLRQKYHNDTSELASAWGDSYVTFDSAKVPTPEMRRTPHRGIFFDPSVDRRVPDYFEFLNNSVADVLLEQSHVVKEACGRNKIVGAFFGYLWINYQHVSQNHSGHLGFGRILRSPDIDYIASPYTYDNRAVGGACLSQTMPTTIAMYGKLFLNEIDDETHMQQRQWRWTPSLNNPKTLEESLDILTRDYAYALSRGFGMWYMDLKGDMYDDPDIVNLFKKIVTLDKENLEVSKEQNTEIAIVLDEMSFTYTKDGEITMMPLLNVQKSWELAYLGTPYDTIRLEDLAAGRNKAYKLYIFLNTFQVTPEQREALHKRFNEQNATVLWVYAPGFIDGDLSVEHMKALTGIQLREHDTPGELRVEITSFDHPYTQSLPHGGLSYGSDVNVATIKRFFDQGLYLKDPLDVSKDVGSFDFCPRFTGYDPDAEVLGQVYGLDEPGLLVKDMGGWTSVYSSAPIVPAELLRNIARESGVHVYSDAGDVIYAGKNYMGIYSPAPGKRTIHLPRKATVVDMIEDKVVAKGVTEFTVDMGPNDSRLYRLK